MKNKTPYATYWLANFIIVYLVNTFFPSNVVVGNGWVSGLLAFIWVGLLITILSRLFKQALIYAKIKKQKRLNMYLIYFVGNSVIVWVLTRIPNISGVGISKFYWAFLLGLLLNSAQWGIRQALKKAKAI